MTVNQRVTGKARSIPAGLGIGLGVSMALTLVGAAVTANLAMSETISENTIGYSAMIILLLSAAAGSWVAAMMAKRRWMPVCIGAGGMYYLTLLAINSMFFGGQYSGIGVTALVILGGCGAIGLLGLRRRAGNKGRKRRFR